MSSPSTIREDTKTTVKWLGNIAFEGATASGHKVLMDGHSEYGGEDKGARPMEMLLLGLGGCSSIDVMLILNKSKQNVTDCVAEVSATRADNIPKVFTHIHVHFVVTGHQIDEGRVKRAVELSAEKYCSASLMLAKSAKITHSYEIAEV